MRFCGGWRRLGRGGRAALVALLLSGAGGLRAQEPAGIRLAAGLPPQPAQHAEPGTFQRTYTTLEQELWRQSLLLAARDACGLSAQAVSADLPQLRESAAPEASAAPSDHASDGAWRLLLRWDRSVNAAALRLERPDGSLALERTVSASEGVDRHCLQLAETYSRTQFPDLLRPQPAGGEQAKPEPTGEVTSRESSAATAGISSGAPAGATAGMSAIPAALLADASGFQPVALLAAAQTLEANVPNYPHPQIECVLARLYANLYVLSAHHPSPTPKEYLARGLLYAQRATVLAPSFDAGRYELAYVCALAGFGEWAAKELDLARMGRAPQESEPAWATLLGAYCAADCAALTTGAGEAGKAENPLRLVLLGLLTEYAGTPTEVERLARELGQAGVDNDRLLRRVRALRRRASGFAEELDLSPSVPLSALPPRWRQERALLDEVEAICCRALTDPATVPGAPPVLDVRDETWLGAGLYPLLAAYDGADAARAGGGLHLAARADAARDVLLPDLMQAIADHPGDPANARRLEQARVLWAMHPAVALQRARLFPDRVRLDAATQCKTYAKWPAVCDAVRRACNLGGQACPPEQTPGFPWSDLDNHVSYDIILRFNTAYAVRAAHPQSWHGQLQGVLLRSALEGEDWNRDRFYLLADLARALRGRMGKEFVPELTALIRDGAGLGHYRRAFLVLLQSAPANAEANAWALHLRAALEPHEESSYRLCALALKILPPATPVLAKPDETSAETSAGGGLAPATAGDASQPPTIAPAPTPAAVPPAPATAQERLALAQTLRQHMEDECGSTPVILLLADILRAGGDAEASNDLVQQELEFFRQYARAMEQKPKGLVRGLHGLALSALTATQALAYYDQLQDYLRDYPQMRGIENYRTAAVALSAARAALLCGQRERAVRLLAQAMAAPVLQDAGTQAFYRNGRSTRDAALAMRWLLDDLLAGGALTGQEKAILEDAGAARIFWQVWK